jgi:hypothetical protein
MKPLAPSRSKRDDITSSVRGELLNSSSPGVVRPPDVEPEARERIVRRPQFRA